MTPPAIAFFLGLPGDVDALAPIIDEARLSGVAAPFVLVHDSLIAKHPRAMATIDWLGVPITVAKEADGPVVWLAALQGAGALFTACETTLRPHRAAHALSLAAGVAGIATFAVQHGFENVGVSYFDAVQGVEVGFAAQTVLSWLRPEVLPAETPLATRQKLRAVGRPRFRHACPASSWPGPARIDVAVFENLHWHRFSDVYRRRVLDDLDGFCAAHPELAVFVRPHPEGRWLTQRYDGARPAAPNLTIADPLDPAWRAVPADEVIARAGLVLTTPSTIALDAAERGLPVGVFAYGLDLPLYAPLPMIAGLEDIERLWAAPRDAARSVAEAFVARTMAGDDAARAALEAALESISAGAHGAARREVRG